MNTLIRWNPYREMISLRNSMDQMLDESFIRVFGETSRPSMGLTIPIDMYERNGDLVIRTDLPGINPEDIDISINDDTLTIKGEFKSDDQEERENVHFQELSYGKFRRAVQLPSRVDPDQAEALFDEGVLKLTLPKTEMSKPRQISVKTGS